MLKSQYFCKAKHADNKTSKVLSLQSEQQTFCHIIKWFKWRLGLCAGEVNIGKKANESAMLMYCMYCLFLYEFTQSVIGKNLIAVNGNDTGCIIWKCGLPTVSTHIIYNISELLFFFFPFFFLCRGCAQKPSGGKGDWCRNLPACHTLV